MKTLFIIAMLVTIGNKPFSSIIPERMDTTRVGICHKQGESFVYKLVNQNAVNGHFTHGDFLYKGRPDVYDWEMDDWCVINAPQN